MANPSAKFSSRIILSKSIQKRRIGQLIQNGYGVLKLSQKTNRSFSLHSGAYYHHSAPPSSRLLLWHSKSSRQLFFYRPIGNNSMGYKLSQDYSSCVSSKYMYERAQMNFNHHRNVFDKNNSNCKVMYYCNNLQSHHRLMSDSLLAIRSDDLNSTNHDLMRSAPMDIEELVQFLRDENASDICVIRVPPHLDYVDYFVVCSGFGGRHLRRMAGGLAAEVWHLNVSHNYSAWDCNQY